METPTTAWRMLTDPADQLVLAVDFPLTGRADANFTDLAHRLGSTWEIRETVPPAPADTSTWTVDSLVAHWDTGIPSGRPVHAVLGFCGGAVFAARLAARLGARQERPRLLLFDPERPTVDTLFRQFHEAVETLRDGVGDEIDHAVQRGRALLNSRAGLAATVGGLVEVYTQTAGAAFDAVGLPGALADELIGMFSSFLRYQVAAAAVPMAPLWTDAVVFGAIDSSYRLARAVPSDAAKEVPVAVRHTDLLRDPAVARIVSEQLR